MNSIDEIYKTIYTRNMPYLRLIAKRKSIPYCEIDDIIQDAFLSFYTHYPTTWPEYKIRSTLVRITHNLCADYFRNQGSELHISLDSAISIAEEFLCSTIDENPIDIALRHQALEEILDIFKTMKKEWRIVLFLYAIQGRSMAEISDILGISESACRMRLTRARRYLKKQYTSKNGVTLVEVIAVMVILAVLAAAIVPSLFGFIDKVKKRRYIIEAYSVKSSAQMFVMEHYAEGDLDSHRVMMELIEGKLTSEKHVLYPYLKIKCSPGARLKGATAKLDTGELLEIVYQVDRYKITLNEDGEYVEEEHTNPKGSENSTK